MSFAIGQTVIIPEGGRAVKVVAVHEPRALYGNPGESAEGSEKRVGRFASDEKILQVDLGDDKFQNWRSTAVTLA